jgi:hypothetical protein
LGGKIFSARYFRRRPKGRHPIRRDKFHPFIPLLLLSYLQKLALLSGESLTRPYEKKRLNLSDYAKSESGNWNERRPNGGSKKGED